MDDDKERTMRRLVMAGSAFVLALTLTGPVMAGGSDVVTKHYYLSLGDSLAAGQQPIGDPGDLYRTSDGYADQLYAIAQVHVSKLEHVKLGCPGETTLTMVNGGICAYEYGSQLATALEFLHAHGKYTSLITIDIGWNDFPCETGLECIPPGVASIQANLPPILAALRSAAPSVPIAGMNLYDPFLGAWLTGPEGQAFAAMTVWDAIVPINVLVEGIYGAFGIPVADVETAFNTTAFSPEVSLEGYGLVPLNVVTICAYTWVCAPPPLGPNNHPNHDGYRAIALAFASVLGW
jgi:lysophospholipase L1-like esterase